MYISCATTPFEIAAEVTTAQKERRKKRILRHFSENQIMFFYILFGINLLNTWAL